MERARLDPWLLWSRAAVVGAMYFGFGVVAHTSAGGLLPGGWGLGALLGLCVVMAAPLLNRAASTPRMVGILVTGQVVVHLVLTATAGHRGDPVAPPGAPARVAARGQLGADALPVVDGRRVGSLQDAYEGAGGVQGVGSASLPIGHLVDDLTAHAPMMVAHVVAAALLGVWLASGERCLWLLIALLGHHLRRPFTLTPLSVPGPRRAARPTRVVALPHELRLLLPHPRRGPPALAA